jgi:type II secretory pathway predicted ATPase ExeA
MNFLQHWSLNHSPFGPVASGDAFYAGLPQREAIARLDYLIRSETRSAVMLSERGCGATTLLSRVAGTSGLGNAAVDAVMTCGGVSSSAAAVARLAVTLGVDPFGDRAAQRVSETITAAGRNQVRTLWLVDRCDVHTARAAAMLATTTRSLCTVMCTSAQLANDLQGALDCCPLRIDLDPFELEDTIGYIRYSLALAGTTNDVFADAALVRLHELSDGKIAFIAAIAQLALMAAASTGAPLVTADCVESVQHELVRAA